MTGPIAEVGILLPFGPFGPVILYFGGWVLMIIGYLGYVVLTAGSYEETEPEPEHPEAPFN